MKTNLIEDSIKSMNELKEGAYKGFTGWLNLESTNIEELKEISEKVRKNSDLLVVVGTGGSFLGAKAVIEALSNPFEEMKVMFIGNDLSSLTLKQSLEYLKNKDFSVNFISKSGSTLEPNICFSLLRGLLEEKYGEKSKERIFFTTSLTEGPLFNSFANEGIKMFHIPEDVGGRFSVFTPAGMFPIAVAGFDVESLLEGALGCRRELFESEADGQNDAVIYSAFRNMNYQLGKKVEVFSVDEPRLKTFAEWWKQLFGESEGKDGKGLFPAIAVYPTDLHSLGQYLQDGPRIILETFFSLEKPEETIFVDGLKGNLSYLNGKELSEISKKSTEGTIEAHTEGGIQCSVFTITRLEEKSLGDYMFFFMLSCAVSAMTLGVNPFNQPGVEAYKTSVKKLLEE